MRLWLVSLLLLAVPASFATADTAPVFPLGCGETLDSLATLGKTVKLSSEIHSDPAFVKSIEAARKELTELLTERDFKPDGTVKPISLKDASDFLRGKPLEEAVARTLFNFDKTSPDSMREALTRIRALPLDQRLLFVESVISRLNKTIEEAMSLLDRDRGSELVKRWNLSNTDEVFALIHDYEIMHETGGADLRIFLLHYFEVASPEEIHTSLKRIRETLPKREKLEPEEKLLQRRIDVPFTDTDLAANKGPISDREFESLLTRLKFKSAYERTAKIVKNPNITGAMVVLSFVPPLIAHAVTGSWDGVTNIIATLMGGVGTSPLLLNVFVHPEHTTQVYWWIKALDLSQLNQLRDFTRDSPKVAKATQLDHSLDLINERIQALRKIRDRKSKS